MARAFIAVVPPEDVLDAVTPVAAEISASTGSGSRATKRAQWHITLRFFGDVDEREAATSLEGLRLDRAQIELAGFGAFPKERRARVVWLGTTQGASWLKAAALQVERLTAHLTSGPTRDFHPHLSLARMKTPRDLRADLRRWRRVWPDPIATWTAREIVLVRSVLTDTGAHHETIGQFALG